MIDFFVSLSKVLCVLVLVLSALYVGRTTLYIGRGRITVLFVFLLCLSLFFRGYLRSHVVLSSLVLCVLFVGGCALIWLHFYLQKIDKKCTRVLGQHGVDAVYLLGHGHDFKGDGRLALHSHPREVAQDVRTNTLLVTHGLGGGPARKEIIQSVVRVSLDDPVHVAAIEGATSRAVAVNQEKREIYVGMWAENCLLVIDAEDFRIKKRIPTHPRPWSLLIDAAERRLLLLNEWEVSSRCSSIEVFDLETLQKIGEKNLGQVCAYGIAKSGKDGRLFISSWLPGTILALDGNDLRILYRKTRALCVMGLSMDDHAGLLYAAVPVRAKVAALDPDTLNREFFIDTEFSCRNLVLDRKRRLLYAGGWITGTLDVLDLGTRRSVKKVFLGRRLRGIALSADGRTLFAVSQCGLTRTDLEAALEGTQP